MTEPTPLPSLRMSDLSLPRIWHTLGRPLNNPDVRLIKVIDIISTSNVVKGIVRVMVLFLPGRMLSVFRQRLCRCRS